MKDVIINITVPTPYVSLNKYSEMTGIPANTCRVMIRDGRIILRPKKGKAEKIEINLIAMLKDAIANS